MNVRFLGTGFLALAIAFTMPNGINAHANSSGLTILSPVALQTYQSGDTVEIKWSTDLSPSPRQAMTVYLLGQKSKKVRIGSVLKKQNSGLYSVTWKIPKNFFESHKTSFDSLNFRIEIRQGNELRNRFISRIDLITIQKSAPLQPAQDGNGSQTDETLPIRSQFVAHYVLKSLYEPWVVKKLTVVNDANNDGFDPDPNETTDAVDKVFVRYPDESGALRAHSASYANGKATLSGLDFYIPSRSSATLDLYVEPIDPKIHGEKYSGKTFRMGIQDAANNSSTFEAVGQLSGTTLNTLASFQVSSSSISESVVKESVLDFGVTEPNPRNLTNGDNDVFDFTVSSKSAGLGRLVFDVNQSGLTSLDGVKLTRNGQFLSAGDASQSGDVYLMWDSGPNSCFAQLAQGGAGTGMDCNGNTAPSAKLILTFSKEEIISGTTAYRLSFNVDGASLGDTVTVRLNHNDDFAKPVITGSDTLNGKIYNAGLDPELFANPTDFANEATSITNRNIIWSDRSADSHYYPVISPAALPTSDSGSSADWTNGYLLGLNALQAITSKR